jgi:SseB protein N-terminal domain
MAAFSGCACGARSPDRWWAPGQDRGRNGLDIRGPMTHRAGKPPRPRRQIASPAWVTIPTGVQAVAGPVNAHGEGRSAQTRVGDADGALRVAIEHGDVAQYVNTLFTAAVIVPTIRDTSNSPWRLGGPSQSSMIEVFTSVEAFERAAPPPAPGATIWFPDLLAAWPNGGYGLAINPGTPLGLSLRDGQVQMLRRWLPEP